MALITCYECGDKVSTTAAACPHCGAPVKKDAVRKDSEVKAENEHTFRAINQIGEVVEQRVNPPELKQNSKLRAGVILAAAVGFIILAAAILRFSQSNNESSEAFSLINSEGSTLSCPSENRESCVRDAESKGFVKLSDTVAGIAVDWTAKPLRIISVKGTAADAGVRNGDILIELDGSEITEPFTIFRVMSRKHPGDKLTMKVLRADRHLYFAYNVMQKEKSFSSAPAPNR